MAEEDMNKMIDEKVKDMADKGVKKNFDEEMKDMIGEETKDMTAEEVKDMSFAEAKGMVVEEVKDMIGLDAKDMIGEETKDVPGEEVKDVSDEEVGKDMSDEEVGKDMSDEEVGKDVSDGEVKDLTAEELKDMTIEEAKDMTIEEAKDMTIEEAKDITAEEAKDITAEEVKDMTAVEVKDVTGEGIKDVTDEDVEDEKDMTDEDQKDMDEDMTDMSDEDVKDMSDEDSKDMIDEDEKDVLDEEFKDIFDEDSKDMIDEDSKDMTDEDMTYEDVKGKVDEDVKEKVEEIIRTIGSLMDHNDINDATGDDDPPLIMQSSNLPFKGLDIRHEGGGNRTSDDGDNNENDEYFEPPRKKIKTVTETNCTSDTLADKSSSNNSTCPFSKDVDNSQPNESENDRTSGAQISSNNGVMEFDILDEFEDNDNEENYSSDSSDISLNELDALLDAGLQTGKHDKTKSADKQQLHEEKQKVILKVRGRDHFDVLPEGWIEVTHNSGMPIYLHKPTRVCSVSKPYFLGPGSTRKHEIPITAIPCLHYLKELEKEKLQEEQKENIEETNEALPSAKLESVKDTKKTGSLDFMAVREYCKKRFEFQTITVKRFKTWSGRRMHQKMLRQKQRPTLPDSTKLITCPLPSLSDKSSSSASNTKREFIMNPCGKSPVCILHEYVQHSLREQPKYIFKELENASTPYGAVVIIGTIEYGYGYGSSKKQAKSQAAKAALDVLIPKMKVFGPEEKSEEQQDLEFFDQVRVEDPRVSELSVKAGQPYPYQILLECLKRNYGMGDTEIYFSMRNLKHQKNEFLMTVGKHSVTVVCKNKRDGKHRASQAILQLLHPHINSWGSLLRMYGKGSCKTLKEKKEEEQRITELQSQACANKPNMSILNKLKEEMLKYREKMKNKKPIGKLIPEQMELSTSDSNLKNVEL